MKLRFTRNLQVALLIVGSAILLFSCDSKRESEIRAAESAMMTEMSEDLSIVMSQNGRRSYFFETPLLEGYTLGQEPYREFRKGIKITTYQDDSLSKVDMVLTANYAIYYEKRELWEAKGDVVGRKFDGKQLYTQQLFWDARTQRIYSNVDTKLVQGNNVSVGESFEANEDLSDWRFRYQKSRIEVEFDPSESDSTASSKPTERKTTTPPAATRKTTTSPAVARKPETITPRRGSVKTRRELRAAPMMEMREIPAGESMMDREIPAITEREMPAKLEPMNHMR
ncbi:MAG: LPS export ABC transporter periplasmic protein LptC [Rikenellaceae bacterium]|nr:LPS export ABC transporter periplasmic protein LptC [Rikenellaceae bacterium]